MATALQNLSQYNPHTIPSGEGRKVGIVVSAWNYSITEKLLEGAISTLLKFGVREQDILVEHVPGSFELTLERSSSSKNRRR